MFEIASRFPRLMAALRLAGFSVGEAVSAINARMIGDDFAAAEAICYVGGASKAIRHARHCHRLARRYRLI
ncbi:hypothetical protein [Mesorhizobium sp. M1B.F.Ca.ET.045.04.1.1]|uniref:hypothetical protein n=1 Tax=Mesorhizobium sp. M1B.F.Ca.ET.045.04.1.1 TaxID=2493673 RepID=UPI000F75616F|nr:hypothetical protein [Mesorhizobium sp. M1B.F.Ca.ET.045.04.1.1]AZO29373.1 hypothetical protein EJ071_19600 [Mesorhizobium sp. M1B.F.Ca.ET.045.04.1.1]